MKTSGIELIRLRNPHKLERWERWVALIGGIFLAALAGWYLLGERMQKVPGPTCEVGASAECVVRVSAIADPTVFVMIAIVAGVGLLLALIGKVPDLTFAGSGASLANESVVAAIASSREAQAEDLEPVSVEPKQGDLNVLEPNPSRGLYLALPPDVRSAAEQRLNDDYPDKLLSEVIEEVRRAKGKGSHPWYIKVVPEPSEPLWIKVTKGGRGRSDARASDSDEPIE